MDGTTFGQSQIGQGGTGFQSGIGLSDKDIASDVLAMQKYVTDLYNKGIAEAASPQVRNTLQQIYNEMQDVNRRVWSYMNQRGWYNPEQADAQTINKLRNTSQNLRQDVMTATQGTSTFSYGAGGGAGYGSTMGNIPQWASGQTQNWTQSGAWSGSGGMGQQSGMGMTGGGGSQGAQAQGYGSLPQWANQPAPGESSGGGQERSGYQSSGGQFGQSGGGYGGGSMWSSTSLPQWAAGSSRDWNQASGSNWQAGYSGFGGGGSGRRSDQQD